MTTNSPNNSFVHDGKLYLLPTLTEDSIGQGALLDGHVYNITDCTFNITRGLSYTQSSTHEHLTAMGSDSDFDADGYYRACSAISNSTVGKIINPVQSARLSTRKSASIRYGKVEVTAKLPTGYVVRFLESIWTFVDVSFAETGSVLAFMGSRSVELTVFIDVASYMDASSRQRLRRLAFEW